MTASTSPAIAARGLRKAFGATTVLDGVDFDVPPGTVFALLGPNGAGKTTTVNVFATLIRPDAGLAQVAGHDVVRHPDAARAAIGLTGQFSAVDDLLTGRENLALMAALGHLARNEARQRVGELLERFDLVEAAGRMVATYSGGMRRRLDLAMTMVGSPQVIFLDEPTTGLDPRSRRTMWQGVRDLVAAGTTVFLTTQHLEEADELADEVAILDHGRIVARGTPRQLKRRIPGGRIELGFADPSARAAAARTLDIPGGDEPRPESTDTLRVPVGDEGNVAALRRVLAALDATRVEIDSVAVETPTLGDVFFALTGRLGDRKITPEDEEIQP